MNPHVSKTDLHPKNDKHIFSCQKVTTNFNERCTISFKYTTKLRSLE